MIRGGSWNNNAGRVRASYRNNRHAGNRNDNQGFRPASLPDRPEWHGSRTAPVWPPGIDDRVSMPRTEGSAK